MKKRLFAGVLALIMALGLLPTGALAARVSDEAVMVEAPSEAADNLAAPVWEDAQAQLAAVDLTDAKWSNLALDMIKNEGNTSVTFNPTGSGNWGRQLSYMTDGDYSTDNAYTQNAVPTDFKSDLDQNYYVQFDLGENRTVGGFEFAVSQENASHGYQYAIYGKADGAAAWTKLVEDTDISHAAGENIKQHPLSAETALRYVRVVLHTGHGGAVGAFAEFKIFGLIPPDLSTLTNLVRGSGSDVVTHANVASISDPLSNLTDEDPATEYQFYGAAIPSGNTGSCWLQFDLGANRSIGGFEFAAAPNNATHGYQYDIYGRANGTAEDAWVRYVSNVSISHTPGENVKQHTLPNMTNLRYIKFVLHDSWGGAWPAIGDIKILGNVQTDPDNPLEGLIEVAKRSEITVPSNGSDTGKIIDGNISTQWAAASGTWPANVDFTLPGNLLVKRVELDFQRFNGRTFDLAVSRAVNNVTSDYQQLSSKTGHDVNTTYVLDLSEAQRMTHVRVSLLGTNGQAWPALAEARIYAVDETIDLKNYDDITAHATPGSGTGYQEWDFHSNQQVVGFRATLAEEVSAVVKGKMKRDDGWTTYVAQLQSGDNVLSFPAGMSAVRVELSDPNLLTDFRIFGTYSAAAVDNDSVAFDKPTHGNFNAATTYQVNDGDKTTSWQPEMYPTYVDIDLEGNYDLTELQVFTAASGYTEYTLYTSIDGQDFDLVASKLNDSPCAAEGDKHTISKTARFIRVYLEYYSGGVAPVLREVRAIGTPSANQTSQVVTFQNVTAFDDTDYAKPITQTDTFDELEGIITRQVGAAYVDWFTFALAPDPSGHNYDYFTLTNEGGKIKITGNDGVSIATGLNHYLKYYCNVHVSQVGNQMDMPAALVPVPAEGVHKETKYPVRYAYNYCTLSYTMSFWGGGRVAQRAGLAGP